MQNWEEIKARLAQAGQTAQQSKSGTIKTPADLWHRPRTRDEMITHFETDWDKLKSFWAANPETAAGTRDEFNLMSFDNFSDWKNWFTEQHPTNEIVMGQGAVPTIRPTSQPITTPTSSYMGQSIGGLASYLKASNLSFGTPKKTDFDIRSPNFKNLPLPSRTADLISKSGINTVWENPYFKRFYNE